MVIIKSGRSMSLKAVSNGDIDMNIKQKIFSHVKHMIDCSANKKILLCCADVFAYKQLKLYYPEAVIDCLQEAALTAFVGRTEVPEENRYGNILDMGLLEKYQWQSDLIRAMGRHLASDGRLAFFFQGAVFSTCYGTAQPVSYLDVVQKMYENWFGPGSLLGFEADGRAVNIANWGGNKKSDFLLYMGLGCDFDRETDWLQSFYTDDIRWELSCLINRIEYGIYVAENVARLDKLCRAESIDSVYLERFMQSVACDVEKVKQRL